MLFALLTILCAILFVVWLIAPKVVPWANQLTRLNAGAGDKAEWMAPPHVVEEVIWNFRESQEWLETCAANWGRFAGGYERYLSGPYLKQQRRALASLVNQKPRIALEQSANHLYSVRHFTSDGLHCLLIDQQTARVLTTLSYWSGRVLHQQHLDDRAYVYQLGYEMNEKRWKIEKFIQELPLGTPLDVALAKRTRVQVASELPSPVRRDN
jgi:hypothetical protein